MDSDAPVRFRAPSMPMEPAHLGPASVGSRHSDTRTFSGMHSKEIPMPKELSESMAQKLVPFTVEAVGTFFLVLMISIAGGPLAPLGIGSILMVLVFMGGHLSGAQYNPAVTLACAVRGDIPPLKAAGYVVVQVIFATLGAATGYGIEDAGLNETFGMPHPKGTHTVLQAFLVELVWTFALCYVVLSVATVNAEGVKGNSYFGVAIGYTVGAGAVLLGGVSGAVFNPAVGTGLTIVAAIAGKADFSFLWIYWAAPLIGAVLAALAFRITNFEEFLTATNLAKAPVMEKVAPLGMEFIGTFFLLLAISLSGGAPILAAFGIGLTLMVMVYAGGHVSGGMYNPAVTLGVCLRGKLDWLMGAAYVVVQLVGGTLAAALGDYVTDSKGYPAPAGGHSIGQDFGAELLFTFLLVSVVLNVATTHSQEKNSFFGIAIGFTVFSGIVGVGGISGAVFNPAVGTALSIIAGDLSKLWIYWLAPLLGGALAALFFRSSNAREYYPEAEAPAPAKQPLLG